MKWGARSYGKVVIGVACGVKDLGFKSRSIQIVFLFLSNIMWSRKAENQLI